MEGILKDLLLSLSNDFELASSGGVRVELGSRAERMSTEMFYLDKTLSSFFTSNFLATITNIIINVVILLCVLLITKHIVKVYGLHRDGDLAEPPSKIIERLIFSVVVLFLSPYIYNSIATISTVIAQTVASAIPSKEEVNQYVPAGFASILMYLYFQIKRFLFRFVIYKQGLEMLILRVTMPFGALGFLSNDGGIASSYASILIKNSATIIFQSVLFIMAEEITYTSGELFLSIACMELAWHGPHIMQNIIFRYGGQSPNTYSLFRDSLRSTGNVIRVIKAVGR